MGNPGDEGYANGEVNFDEKTFRIDPIIKDFRRRTLVLVAYGTIENNKIEVNFESSVLNFILPTIIYVFLPSFLIQYSQTSWITIPFLALALILTIFSSRKYYKKDLNEFIKFLDKMNVR